MKTNAQPCGDFTKAAHAQRITIRRNFTNEEIDAKGYLVTFAKYPATPFFIFKHGLRWRKHDPVTGAGMSNDMLAMEDCNNLGNTIRAAWRMSEGMAAKLGSPEAWESYVARCRNQWKPAA